MTEAFEETIQQRFERQKGNNPDHNRDQRKFFAHLYTMIGSKNPAHETHQLSLRDSGAMMVGLINHYITTVLTKKHPGLPPALIMDAYAPMRRWLMAEHGLEKMYGLPAKQAKQEFASHVSDVHVQVRGIEFMSPLAVLHNALNHMQELHEKRQPFPLVVKLEGGGWNIQVPKYRTAGLPNHEKDSLGMMVLHLGDLLGHLQEGIDREIGQMKETPPPLSPEEVRARRQAERERQEKQRGENQARRAREKEARDAQKKEKQQQAEAPKAANSPVMSPAAKPVVTSPVQTLKPELEELALKTVARQLLRSAETSDPISLPPLEAEAALGVQALAREIEHYSKGLAKAEKNNPAAQLWRLLLTDKNISRAAQALEVHPYVGKDERAKDYQRLLKPEASHADELKALMSEHQELRELIDTSPTGLLLAAACAPEALRECAGAVLTEARHCAAAKHGLPETLMSAKEIAQNALTTGPRSAGAK